MSVVENKKREAVTSRFLFSIKSGRMHLLGEIGTPPYRYIHLKEAFVGFLGAQWVLNPQPSDPQSDVPPIELWAPCFERADYITTFTQIQGFYGLR
jgi:hypothetical protein